MRLTISYLQNNLFCSKLLYSLGLKKGNSKVKWTSGSCLLALLCPTLCNPRDDSGASLSMEFSRQEHWSGLPFPPLGDLPSLGTEPASPALAGRFFTTESPGPVTDWFKIGKGIRQGCISSPCLLHLYAEHIMKNTEGDGSQAGIKIARRNINNFRYVYDTNLMAEYREELKSLLMKVKEERKKTGLKLRSWHLVPSLHGK